MGSPYILQSQPVTPLECLHCAMNLPVAVVITGCGAMAILEQALGAARTFKPLSASQVAALLAKTQKAAADGQYEHYKSPNEFDGTGHNPQWLGT